MRPAGVESNHYAYHLEKLIGQGLVVKQMKAYSLSTKGLALVDRLSHDKMADRIQPHIVTAIDITNDAGETLVFKRFFQPYIYRIGFPLGKVHAEESITTAANRELYEKTGLSGIALTQRGIVYVEATVQGIVISKILCHVFQSAVAGHPEVAPLHTHRGECFWSDAASLDRSQLMPGFSVIKQHLALAQPGIFFDEITEELQ